MASVAKSKAKNEVGVLEGYLMYVQIVKSVAVFAERKNSKPQNTEFKLDIIVTEDEADAWDEKFPKQEAKKIKASDFEEIFKVPVPEKFKGEKNLYRIQLKKSDLKDGKQFNPDFRPKAFLDKKDENGEIVREEITTTKLIANGSYGKVSYTVQSNDYGNFAYLKNILLDEENFIEYVQSGNAAGSEFGGNPVKTKMEKPASKKAAEEEPEEEAPWEDNEEEEGSDDPF